MIKREYTEKNPTENMKPMNHASGNRMHYDERRVAAEKNTMRRLDEKREAYDTLRFETTTDMIAFQPKSRSAVEESTADGSYQRSDVEKNIDEAERYINLIATQKSEKKVAAPVEKNHKPLPTTTEIRVFEPRVSFGESEQAKTAIFSPASQGADPMSGDAAMTRAYRVGGAPEEQTRAYRVGGAPEEQTRAYRVGGAPEEQTRAYRVGGAPEEQTRAYRVGGASEGQTRAYRVGGNAADQTRAYPIKGSKDEFFDAYSGRMTKLRDSGEEESFSQERPFDDTKSSVKSVEKEKSSVRFEYTSTMQNERIEGNMHTYYKKVKLRLVAAVFLAALLFLVENIAPVKAIFPNRFFYIAVDWVLAFACIFLISERLGNAFKSFFKRTPEVDCITILAFFFSIAATAVELIFENTESVITLYNFPFAVCVFLNLLFLYYRVRRDIDAFSVLSSSGDKRAVVLGNSKDDFFPEEEYFVNYDKSETVKFGEIKSVNFIDGYFAHGAEAPSAQATLKIFIPFCLATSLIFFFCSLFVMNHTIPESLGIAYATFMVCAPFSAFVDYCYPLYLAARHAKTYRSAILCDKTPDMYRDSEMIVFRDTEAIPSGKAKVKSIRLYGDKKIDNAIYYASSIYSVVGGPLAEVFRSAALNSVSSENVQIREVSNDGVSAMVDGKNIVIGRPSYMEEQCFETMNEAGDDEYDGKTNKRILYLACDQFIIAKFYIQYSVGAEFLNIANRLLSAGIGISVRTADPCLDDGIFYENRIDPEQNAIRISRACLRKKEEDSVPASRAGLVSDGEVTDLVKALLLCRRLENVRRTNLVLKIVASVFAVAVMALVLFTGNGTGMYSVYPALYQLFWILPTYFVSKVYL